MAMWYDAVTRKRAMQLVKYGFIQDKYKDKYSGKDGKGKSPEEVQKEFDDLSSDAEREKKLREFEEHADMHWMEVQRDQLMATPYPKPESHYYMIYESYHEAIEPIYFWCYNHFVYDWSFPLVHKVSDIFTASQHSSFYGASAQRLGLAQDKVQQFLANIGRMTKDLFSLVREIRVIDERMVHYKDIFELPESKSPQEKEKLESKRREAEVVLKGLWVDLVDGVVQGQRTAANLFLMAQQLQFTSLPTVFFNTHPKTTADIDGEVEKRDYNRDMKTALTRKLRQYVAWRDSTYEEMKQRRIFTLDYTYQHYQVIRMYIQWVKPYLKHVEKLTSTTDQMGRADLVSSFEGSMIELEFLAQRLFTPGNKEVYSCVLMTFEYRTKPELSFAREGGFHRGPIHVGQTTITWRSYAWTQDQIERYLKLREDSDFELLSSIDDSLRVAMEGLGNDLKKYLEEKRKDLKEKKEGKAEEKKQVSAGPSVWGPFVDVAKGAQDLFSAFIPKGAGKKAGGPQGPSKDDRGSAAFGAKLYAWQHYKNFKKAHGMLTW